MLKQLQDEVRELRVQKVDRAEFEEKFQDLEARLVQEEEFRVAELQFLKKKFDSYVFWFSIIFLFCKREYVVFITDSSIFYIFVET